jgi:hypothetical protein
MLNISSHANHRHEDYFFERTQSRAFQDLQRGKTTPPLRSWGDYVYPALAGVGALVALIEIIH